MTRHIDTILWSQMGKVSRIKKRGFKFVDFEVKKLKVFFFFHIKYYRTTQHTSKYNFKSIEYTIENWLYFSACLLPFDYYAQFRKYFSKYQFRQEFRHLSTLVENVYFVRKDD